MENKDKAAFPLTKEMCETSGIIGWHNGLTKREYFAVKCMPTADSFFGAGDMCSSEFIMDFLEIPKQIQIDKISSVKRKYDSVSMYPKAVAKMAIVMADELLKQLEQ